MHANVLEAPTQQSQDLSADGRTARSAVVAFLDSAIPLRNASHGDVLRYEVQTVWRHAECIATLADGRQVKLSDTWQFIGYTGKDHGRRLLFRRDGSHIEVQITDGEIIVAMEAHQNGYALDEMIASISRRLANFLNANTALRVLDRERTYTAIDGRLVSVAGCEI